jgi:hypothetical protein
VRTVTRLGEIDRLQVRVYLERRFTAKRVVAIMSPLYEGSVAALVTVAIELRKMPPPYRDSGYYREKAKEARARAERADDPFQAMAMLEMAFVYELTAVRAEAMRSNRPRLPNHPNGQRRWRRR